MKIETEFAPKQVRVSLQNFADDYGLTMLISEREHVSKKDPSRFYARFKNCEVKRGCGLVSLFGNGVSPRAAMHDYCSVISGELLVVDAWGKGRREIQVPDLYLGASKKRGEL